jgi:cation transport ATPase
VLDAGDRTCGGGTRGFDRTGLAGRRFGVDAIALVSMSAAIALGQPLAGAVVALMYSGGNVLEDIAVARAVHDLHSLVDRAPREAHRRVGDRIEEVPISAVAVGDQLLVRAGEVVPVNGVVTASAATIDESALTGEPIPVVKARGGAILRLVECRRDLRTIGVCSRRAKAFTRISCATAAQTAK